MGNYETLVKYVKDKLVGLLKKLSNENKSLQNI